MEILWPGDIKIDLLTVFDSYLYISLVTEPIVEAYNELWLSNFEVFAQEETKPRGIVHFSK